MNGFSIHDRLNYFGKATIAGPLLESNDYGAQNSGGVIYVGKGDQTPLDKGYGMIATRKDSKGGQLGQPYFAEFFVNDASEESTPEIILKVQGAFWGTKQPGWTDSKYDPLKPDGKVPDSYAGEGSPTWKDLGVLTIPAGEYDERLHPRVAFSDSKYKHFRCYAEFTADEGVTVLAFLHKAVE